jgi:hypothetical protein
MVMSAPRKAGKSNLVLNMLSRKDMLKGIWNPKDIFIFSPTMDVNDDYKDIKANKIAKFDNEIIHTIMDTQKNLIKQHGQHKVKPLLIVCDDCLGEKKFASMNSCMEMLATKGRHLLISVIIITQSLRRVGRTIRLNSDYFVIFRAKNQTEYDAIAEEFISKSDRPNFLRKLKEQFKIPYNFLVIDLVSGDEDLRFRIKFTEPFYNESPQE